MKKRRLDDYQAVLGLGIVLTIGCLVASATTGIHYFLEGAVLVSMVFQIGIFNIYAKEVQELVDIKEEEEDWDTITIPVISGNTLDMFSSLLENMNHPEEDDDYEEYEEIDDE